MKSGTMKSLLYVLGSILVFSNTLSAQLYIDFNSMTQDGGPHNQEGFQPYDAGHERAEDFIPRDYFADFFGEEYEITITPEWPNTTDNRTRQMIDRGNGNDANWLGDEVDLLTDWLGADSRPANGGHGDWNRDDEFSTPTYMTLTLAGLPDGGYSWLSFHHDTENIWSDFQVEISTDGGETWTDPILKEMTDSTPGGNPASLETFQGFDSPDPRDLPSCFRAEFVSNGDDVVFRFAPFADGVDPSGVHKQFFAINGFELTELDRTTLVACIEAADGADSLGVNFDAGCTFVPDGAQISDIEWDFGDGNAAVGSQATHVYAEPGAYEVTLFVEDNQGNFDEAKRTIEVSETTLSITPEELTLSIDDSVQLEVMLSGDFDFSDDVTSGDSGTNYSSDPEGIVSIGEDGLLTALAVGETVVTATNGDFSSQAMITVQNKTIAIKNSGFEELDLDDGEWVAAGGPDWRFGQYNAFQDPNRETWVPGGPIDRADAGVWNPDGTTGFPASTAFEGNNTGWAISGIGVDFGLYQVLDADLVANTEYQLTVQVGNPFYNERNESAPYRIELVAGGVVVASQTDDSPRSGRWAEASLIYQSANHPNLVGQALEIRLLAVEFVDEQGVDGYQVDFDDVRLSFKTGSTDSTSVTFLRGDVDANGLLEITDPINNLSFQFLGNFSPPCLDAADFDDNGKVEITDPIANLSHQFIGTVPPAAPGAENCGLDATGDELTCESFDVCKAN